MKSYSILTILFLLLFSSTVHSQFTYKIKADSLLVTNDSCNAELNLENRTRNVNGFLYNKGNGRTEFRKALIQLEDGRYLIGADTLRINTSSDSNYILNQYAYKQRASAWIDTLRTRLITIPDSVNKTVSKFSETGISISGALKDSDTSSATVSKSGDEWNTMNPPLIYLTTAMSRNSYDLWGSPLLVADRQWNVDTLTNAFWSSSGSPNPVLGDPVVNIDNTIRLKGYANAPTYTLHNDDWRGQTLRVQTNYGKSPGSTGSWKLQYAYQPHQNILSYIDFNNGSTVNFDFDPILYAAGVQVNRVDTFKSIRYYSIMPANAKGIKAPGSGARDQIGFQVPDLSSWDIADNNFAFQALGPNDRNYFAGQIAIGDSSSVNAESNKFYVSGSSKFSGTIYQGAGYRTLLNGAVDDSTTALQVNGSVSIKDVLNLGTSTPPTSSADTSGSDGDLKRDAQGNLYLKANGQWLKFTGVTF